MSTVHNFKVMRDPSYAPCGFLIVRRNADGVFNTRSDANTVLVQSDWDFPGVARSFGWDMRSPGCDHDSTDGTVTCNGCGRTASDFITAAFDWLAENEPEGDGSDYFHDWVDPE